MKLLRVLLTWILMLALPASSWAALEVAPLPCAMQELAGMTAEAPAAEDGGCCDETAGGGMACAHQCPLPPVALPSVWRASVLKRLPSTPPETGPARLTDGALPTLWRPPAA